MSQAIHETKKVDLRKYPNKSSSARADAKNQLTIGDLHGNALKLIYFLIKENVINISEKQYYELVKIYRTSLLELNAEHLSRFNQILNAATLNEVNTVRLIGDELADRGENDYFTLKVLEKLGENDVHIEILLSNHGYEFLKNSAAENLLDPELNLLGGQARSLSRLSYLLDSDIIKPEDISNIIEKYYKLNLKAISYTIDKSSTRPSITIYTHAPVGLETIEATANLFNVPYNSKTPMDLGKTIDKINHAFTELLKKNQLKEHMTAEFDLGEGDVSIEYPLLRLTWNRCHQSKASVNPGHKKKYPIRFVHGHDGPGKPYFKNFTNLDNDLGKYMRGIRGWNQWVGEYNSLYSQEISALERESLQQEQKAEAIEKLNGYISERREQQSSTKSEYTSNWAGWFKLQGRSASVKISAATKVVSGLNGEAVSAALTDDEVTALSKDRLGAIIKGLSGIGIDAIELTTSSAKKPATNFDVN